MIDLRPADLSSLARTVELQRVGCELAGSDLYARLLAVVAGDLGRGGPCRDLLGPHAGAPVADAVLLRLLAGVHALVLDGRLPELAVHYPSVDRRSSARGRSMAVLWARRAGDGSLAEAFLAAVDRHADDLQAALKRGVQTNEVGRSAALLCGFLDIARGGLPLRVLEVGASAGLNLSFDRYRYRSGDWAYGPADSPVRFEEPYRGRSPRSLGQLQVVERRGCDVDPIDPSTGPGALRLRSFVWPDQQDRLDRLDAALAVAAAHPVAVDRADAVSWLEERLTDPVAGVATVVTHSIVFQYLAPGDRSRFLALLEEAGARAGPDAPLAWLRMEPGGDTAEVRLTEWPGGRSRLVARSGYHGPPVTPLQP